MLLAVARFVVVSDGVEERGCVVVVPAGAACLRVSAVLSLATASWMIRSRRWWVMESAMVDGVGGSRRGIVVGLSWTGVGGREFAVGGHVVGACWFIHDDGDNWDGSTEADGMGGVHFVDRGGVVAGAGGEDAWGGGCHGGPVGWFWRRCVDNTMGCGD